MADSRTLLVKVGDHPTNALAKGFSSFCNFRLSQDDNAFDLHGMHGAFLYDTTDDSVRLVAKATASARPQKTPRTTALPQSKRNLMYPDGVHLILFSSFEMNTTTESDPFDLSTFHTTLVDGTFFIEGRVVQDMIDGAPKSKFLLFPNALGRRPANRRHPPRARPTSRSGAPAAST